MTYPIEWSPLVGSPRKFKLGVQLVTQPVPAKGQASVTCTWDIWVQSPYAIDEIGDLYWEVGASSGWQVTGSSAPGVQVNNSTAKIGTITAAVPVTSRKPLDWWLWAGLDGIVVADTGTMAEVNIDGFLWFAAPATPTSVTATRVSDTTTTVSWGLVQDNAERVENVVVQRWDAKSGTTKTVATLGYATSYTDRSTQANNRYRYTVYAKNRSATGASASSGYISTKPTPPGGVKAGRTVSGDMQVTWTNMAAMPGVTEVWDNPNGVYANTVKVGEVALPGASFTYAASTVQTHQYYLKHRTSDSPVLTSSDSPNSNTVALPSPPYAPSGIGPTVMDPVDLTPITWVHNSSDTTGQRKLEVQYRQVGAGSWISSGQTTSTVSAWATPGTWPTGVSMEVQVRTWGVHASPSPWSPTAIVKIDGKPVVTILAPGTTVNASAIVVELAYYDPEGTAQSAAVVELATAGGDVLETVAIDGPGTLAPVVYRLADLTTYQVRARVRDGAGLWSATAVTTIAVAYLRPPAPAVTAAWVGETGAVVLTLSHVPPAGAEVAAMTYEVWRDGSLVASGLSPEPGSPVTITDPLPPVSALVYQVVSWSALPSSAITEVVMPDVPAIANRVWVNGGTGWSEVGCLVGDLKVDVSAERARSVEHFSGRRLPVETIGEAVTEQVKVTGMVPPGADHEVFSRIQLAGTTVCLRWPEGRRFVSMGQVDVGSNGRRGGHSVSFGGTTIDYQEG